MSATYSILFHSATNRIEHERLSHATALSLAAYAISTHVLSGETWTYCQVVRENDYGWQVVLDLSEGRLFDPATRDAALEKATWFHHMARESLRFAEETGRPVDDFWDWVATGRPQA